jgi:hypothetical protein
LAVKGSHFRDRRASLDEANHVEKGEDTGRCTPDLKDSSLGEKQGKVEVIPQRSQDGNPTDLAVMGQRLKMGF